MHLGTNNFQVELHQFYSLFLYYKNFSGRGPPLNIGQLKRFLA